MPEVKPKARSRTNQSWREALDIYQGEIEDRKILRENLAHFRDGQTDEDWLIIQKACEVIDRVIARMTAKHADMLKKLDE